jgi:hypothetical protein
MTFVVWAFRTPWRDVPANTKVELIHALREPNQTPAARPFQFQNGLIFLVYVEDRSWHHGGRLTQNGQDRLTRSSSRHPTERSKCRFRKLHAKEIRQLISPNRSLSVTPETIVDRVVENQWRFPIGRVLAFIADITSTSVLAVAGEPSHHNIMQLLDCLLQRVSELSSTDGPRYN